MYTLKHLLCDEKGMPLPYAWARPIEHKFKSSNGKDTYTSEWHVGELVHLRCLFLECALYRDEELINYSLTPQYEGGVTLWFGDTMSMIQSLRVGFS